MRLLPLMALSLLPACTVYNEDRLRAWRLPSGEVVRCFRVRRYGPNGVELSVCGDGKRHLILSGVELVEP